MVEETSLDYANYLRQIDFSKEIGPICTNIDEILTRMDEFESSISTIKNIASVTSIPDIVKCKNGIQQYSDRIDKIQVMLDRINVDVTALEQNMTKAEEDLGYNNTGIKGFFKPLLGKISKNRSSQATSTDESEPTFQPTETFKANVYFGESNSSLRNDTDGTSES